MTTTLQHWLVCLTLAFLVPLGTHSVNANDPVFSGPQVGEALPPLPIERVLSKSDGERLDLVERAAGKPTLVIFFHARTRPGFALTRALLQYANKKQDTGLQPSIVFLADDVSETRKWIETIQKLLPSEVTYGVSHDGIEGPGAYGLNRNMTLTVLVANEGKVTGNFALIQPQLQADGPKILQAIADVTGGGPLPTVDELLQAPSSGREKMKSR